MEFQFTPGSEPTDEQKRWIEQQQMRNAAVFDQFKRLLAELPVEQLQLIGLTFTAIANCSNPVALANYYEGIINGVLWARDVRLGELAEGF